MERGIKGEDQHFSLCKRWDIVSATDYDPYGEPEGQGNTWVDVRTTSGNSNGVRKVQHVLTGSQWTPMAEWKNAISANKSGLATESQKSLLKSSHHPSSR